MFLHKLACWFGYHLWDYYRDQWTWYSIRECYSCGLKERWISEGNWMTYNRATKQDN